MRRSATYAVGSPAEPSATGERAGSSTRAWTVARRAGCGSRGARAGSARRLGGMFSPFEKGYRSDLECGGAEGLAVRQLEPQPVEAGGQLGELEASVHVGRSVIGALLTLDLAHLHGATQRRYEPAVQPGAPFVVGRRDPHEQLDVVRAEAQRVGLRS